MKTKLIAISYLLSAFCLSAFAQGSLTPPGAPAPTMKSLDQIEPRTPIASMPFFINNPGSYYLVQDLTQTNATHGITVNANDVTIDLNGFSLIGTNGTANGIYVSGKTNIVVRNGTIRNWDSGIVLTSFAGGNYARLENVECNNNSQDGINSVYLTEIIKCTCIGNATNGISVASGCVVRNCCCLNNGTTGIHVTGDSLVVDNYVRNTAATAGTVGIMVSGTGDWIENNYIAHFQTGVLVLTSFQSFVLRNTVLGATTNYSISAVSVFGPINSSIGVATNHPWANFSL